MAKKKVQKKSKKTRPKPPVQVKMRDLPASKWRPTQVMEKYLKAFVEHPFQASETRICLAAGVDRSAVWRWKNDPNWQRWFTDKIMGQRGLDFVRLHKFGMTEALSDRKGFPYWKNMYWGTGKAIGRLVEDAVPQQNIFAQAIINLAPQMEAQGPPDVIEGEIVRDGKKQEKEKGTPKARKQKETSKAEASA